MEPEDADSGMFPTSKGRRIVLAILIACFIAAIVVKVLT